MLNTFMFLFEINPHFTSYVLAELDKMCDYNNNLKRQASEKADMSSYDNAEITKYLRQHQDDCITINQLQAALDVIVDRYANLRKIHGVS
jgi:hypothetical protein